MALSILPVIEEQLLLATSCRRERMFTYRYRLRDSHKKPIASLAILIDSNPEWRPGFYKEELWGSSMEMRFPIIKLIDYQSRIKELEASTNPFSSVILAQLATL